MTNDGISNVYGYDPYNKLIWAAVSGTPTCGSSGKCITYDAFGRMVEKSSGSGWTEIWYTQVSGSQVYMLGTTASYAYWPSPGRGTFVASGTNMFMHQDWLGNDRVVSSVTGHTVTADRAYAPYGQQYNAYGSTNPIYGIFAGLTGDFDSGVLFDTPNRELAQYQGRWLTPDPAGAGWNQYAYVTNPLSFTDPLGLFCLVGHCDGDDPPTPPAPPPDPCIFADCGGPGQPPNQPPNPPNPPGTPKPGKNTCAGPNPPVPCVNAANNGTPQTPCSSAGNAPSPGQYQAMGYVAQASWLFGPGVGGLSNAGALAMFKRGLPLDAQVIYGGSPAYANYTYGVFMSSAGYSLDFALWGANAYGAQSSSYTFSPTNPPDPNYPAIPASNVANITAGFNAQQTGTLCHK